MTKLTPAQFSALSLAINIYGSAVPVSSNKRMLRSLTQHGYIQESTRNGDTILAVTPKGLDALITEHIARGLESEVNHVRSRYIDHLTANTEAEAFDAATTQSVNAFLQQAVANYKAASQPNALACTCGECYDCTKSLAYERTSRDCTCSNGQCYTCQMRAVEAYHARNGYTTSADELASTDPVEAIDQQFYNGQHNGWQYESTSVTPANMVADMIPLLRIGDRVKLTSDALYFGPGDDRIATITSYPNAFGDFQCVVMVHGYRATKRINVCQIEVLNPFI